MAHVYGGRPQAAHALGHVGEVLEQAHVGVPALVVLVAEPRDQQRAAQLCGAADLDGPPVERGARVARRRVRPRHPAARPARKLDHGRGHGGGVAQAGHAHGERGVAVRKVGGAVQRVDAPQVLAVHVAVDAALLAQYCVLREGRPDDAQHRRLAGLVGVGDQVDGPFVGDRARLVHAVQHDSGARGGGGLRHLEQLGVGQARGGGGGGDGDGEAAGGARGRGDEAVRGGEPGERHVGDRLGGRCARARRMGAVVREGSRSGREIDKSTMRRAGASTGHAACRATRAPAAAPLPSCARGSLRGSLPWSVLLHTNSYTQTPTRACDMDPH